MFIGSYMIFPLQVRDDFELGCAQSALCVSAFVFIFPELMSGPSPFCSSSDEISIFSASSRPESEFIAVES